MLSSDEFWARIKTLKGKTVFTPQRGQPNRDLKVTEDRVSAEGRKSKPTKAQIYWAYEKVWRDGKLLVTEAEWLRNRRVLSFTLGILLAAFPDELEKKNDGGPFGIRLRPN